MRMRNLLLPALFLAFGAGGASATTIQYHVAFGAGNFTVDPNPGGVTPPLLVSGSFDIDLDIGTSPTDQTAGIHNTTIGAENFALGTYPFVVDTPWAYSYDKTTDILVVGGSANGAGVIQFDPAENDFYLQIHDFSSANPLMWQLGFAQIATPGTNFFTPTGGDLANGFVQVTALGPVVAAAPLPAGLPLFLTAIAGLGLVFGLRKTIAAPGVLAPLA
jgi:hypothetical protein